MTRGTGAPPRRLPSRGAAGLKVLAASIVSAPGGVTLREAVADPTHALERISVVQIRAAAPGGKTAQRSR